MPYEGDPSPDSGQPEGRYANYFEVGHNAVEFLLDFGQLYTENGEAQLHTRIITGPTYAKAFLEVLREALDRYEKTFGCISDENTVQRGG